jgi:cell division septum initiation protein DivIVA
MSDRDVHRDPSVADLAKVGARNGERARPVETVSVVVEHAAALVDELNHQLIKVNEWAARERSIALSEQQIGRLLAEAERTAQRTVEEARKLAQEIVASAADEASRVRAGVGLPPVRFEMPQLSPEAIGGAMSATESPADEVRALRQALIEFSRTNASLITGISELVDVLATRTLETKDPLGRS